MPFRLPRLPLLWLSTALALRLAGETLSHPPSTAAAILERLLERSRTTPDRVAGSLAVGCFALAANSAQILRVHDVAPTRDAAILWDAISQRRTPRTL